jgi:hypothetical protein
MSDLINKLYEKYKRKIKPRKTRRQKATKSVRKDLNKRLGAHDRWTKMATDPMFTKSIGRWVKLRDELRSREVDMGDIGGLFIQDKMEEQGFARRIFKVEEVKR